MAEGLRIFIEVAFGREQPVGDSESAVRGRAADSE